MGSAHAPFLIFMRSVVAASLCLAISALFPETTRGAQDQPSQVRPAEPSYHFDITGTTQAVEHVFQFLNNTKETVEIGGIRLTPPLTVPNISARVRPGELGMLKMRLGEPRPVGDYEGLIEVEFKNPGVSSITFEVTGKITPLIEAKPFPAFFVSTQRGQSKEASIQLLNHDEEPVHIYSIETSGTRFSLRLQTNQPGQDYTLFLKLSGEGKPGRTADPITLKTTSKREPVLLISANTTIHERVHTFPDDLDFGTIESAAIKTNEALRKTLTQILMVYQDGGTNFRVTAKTDLPFLSVAEEPAKSGKQVQIELALKPEELRPGDFQGHLDLVTNDPEFRNLSVAVRGRVQ